MVTSFVQRIIRNPRRYVDLVAGHVITIIVGALVIWAGPRADTTFIDDFSALVFALAAIYATFRGGIVSGLICGAIAWPMLAAVTSETGALFSFSAHGEARIRIMAVAFPSLALLVHFLRRALARENAQLREADELWRLLAAHVPDAVATVRKNGTVQYVNRDLPWTGVDKDAVIDQPLEALLPKESRATVKKMVPRVFSTGEAQHAELRLEGEGGAPAWYDLRVVPVMRKDTTVAALATFTDMTRRFSEEDAHQRLVALVNSSNAAIFGSTVDGIITSWNPGARRMYGYLPETIIGKPVATLLPPETAADAQALLTRVRGGEHVERVEMLHRKRDGSPLEVTLNASPVGKKGAVSEVAFIARDVGEKKRAEADRQRAFALLAEAEKLAHVGSWEWDLASDASTWTDELYRILGLEPGAVRPTLDAYLSRIDTGERERVRQAVRKARTEGTPFSFDHRLTRPNGDLRILRTHGAVIRGARGETTRVIGTVHDVTALRKIESRLAAQRDRLQAEMRTDEVGPMTGKSLPMRALEDAPVILWSFDRELRITMAQGRGIVSLGLDAASVVGKNVAELTGSDSAATRACLAALGGETVHRVLRFRDRDFHTAITPIKDRDSGVVTGAIGVSIDLTDAIGPDV